MLALQPEGMWCTFCGKGRAEVRTLIAGPGVNVCNECVSLFDDIKGEALGSSPPPGMAPCVFCGEHGPRVFAPWAAFCHACTDLAAGILRQGA